MNKRLPLKKETLRSLDATELEEANGGTYFNRYSLVAAGAVRTVGPPPPPIHESGYYFFGG